MFLIMFSYSGFELSIIIYKKSLIKEKPYFSSEKSIGKYYLADNSGNSEISSDDSNEENFNEENYIQIFIGFASFLLKYQEFFKLGTFHFPKNKTILSPEIRIFAVVCLCMCVCVWGWVGEVWQGRSGWGWFLEA